MGHIVARDLLSWSEDEVWSLPLNEMSDLEFDDGVVKDVVHAEVALSWYLWQITAYYPQVPLLKEYCVKGKVVTDELVKRLFGKAVLSTRQFPEIEQSDIWRIGYRDWYNKMFVAASTRLLRHITSFDAADVTELLDDEELKEAKAEMDGTPEAVEHVYGVIKKMFTEKPVHQNKQIVRSLRYKTVKLTQMYPSFGPLGARTDVDSVIYRVFTTRGFAEGLTKIEDFAKESRSAAKALLYNKDPVAIAEYFNRKLQFVVAYVKRIAKGDCGTYKLHTFDIPDDENGRKLIDHMEGINMLVGEGKFRPIKKGEHSLCGKSIQFRTALTCKDLKNGGVCEKCFGEMSYSIPEGDNLGHVSCTSVNEPMTQGIISTKHLDFFIMTMLLKLNRNEQKFMYKKPKDEEYLYLNNETVGRGLYLQVYKKEVPEAVSLRYVEELNILNPSNISNLTEITFASRDEEGMFLPIETLSIEKKGKSASFAVPFLQHMKKVGIVSDELYYYIPLDGFKSKSQFILYPQKHESMVAFSRTVERFLRSSKQTGSEDNNDVDIAKGHVSMLTRYGNNVDRALYDTHYLLASKINTMYLGHLAVVLAASRVCSPEELDYAIGSSDDAVFATHDDIIRYNSLGVSWQYQAQPTYLNDFDSYLVKKRMSSTLDDLTYIPEGKYPQK